MAIRIRFFASLRERMGRSDMLLDDAAGTTVAEIWSRISGGHEVPARVLAAVNQEHVHFDHRVREDDEVAFFPPVTGG